LSEQIEEFKPEFVFLHNPGKFQDAFSLFGKKTRILINDEELTKLVKNQGYHILISSLVGFSGLIPTINALEAGKRVALANKETMVVAGEIMNEVCRRNSAEIIPVDSEHSAIFQCLTGENHDEIEKIILTASGGPFLGKKINDLRTVTVEQALKHPNWNMGSKITIDSATLMNKGLEVIEAKWLFNIDVKQIEVRIHPQSIIHSMVEFKDASIKAQMGVPDMRVPIQYAITYPVRIKSDYPKVDFNNSNKLEFYEPDYDNFRCLKLAFQALESGGTYPTVLNAANETAVELFLNRKIKFLEIPEIIENALQNHDDKSNFNIEGLVEVNTKVKNIILNKF
ncbi:MAG: 1-deoxy-D-xylulose-5-phosphate reductoisomerase, partial [Ignavibacteria bacterium]|nr:1-deoxy-D-xylulose-5-phosphate reductoisomerase [Ignavibacteria bacterium]